jgi:HK97 family phage major capsid protein
LTKEQILARLAELNTVAETRSFNDDEFTEVTDLETKLAATRQTEEFRARHQVYVTPVNHLGAHIAEARPDDTLERAFGSYLRTGQANQDITELRAQAAGTTTAGGFTVPTTMLGKITDRLKAFGGVANEVETITTATGGPITWPTLDDVDNVGVIKAENTAPSGGADLVFGEKTLSAFTYSAPGANSLPLTVSFELLQDSAFDVEALIVRKLTQRIAARQSADWVNGTGTTMPLGLATGTGVAAGTFANATIGYADLLSAVHQVDPAYRDSSVWTFNDFTLSLIEGVLDGNGRPLLNNAMDGIAVGRSNQMLLGYRVVIDPAWANYADATTNKWGAFGNLMDAYIIRRVQDVVVFANPYSLDNEGSVRYTLRARADGTVQDPNAYRVLQNQVA